MFIYFNTVNIKKIKTQTIHLKYFSIFAVDNNMQ